ncbi:alpha/beta hydrolase [Sphingomonas sp. RIT328]|uniref:alpha/beta hydrolase n=1 Tax=Sphingomonas sp. RIT328 TaxID=1470591 RepID=UPI00044BB108|nr:alpha/beta hydrolase fold domain-containing protein [Sphingomonas sp. RIT328]EZP50027.1 Alpha/beta hydrolase fold-3 domain protein [Sphingomonas sp. RIT328]
MPSRIRYLMHRAMMAAMVAAAARGAATADTGRPAGRNLANWDLPNTLSPEGRAMAAAMAAAPSPDPTPPLEAQRRFVADLQAGMGAELAKRHQVRVENSSIAGVAVRILLPKGVKTLGDGPVLLNLHGGGFQADSGSLTETIPIAAMTGIPVVAVLYRLAPEHPYPAALDDALAVYQNLERTHGASGIAVYGTSAGAALSGQLLSRLGMMKRPMPAALGYFSGSADLSTSGDSESWMPLPGGAKTMRESVASYVGTTSVDDPILSPLKGDVSRFPPTLLVTSTRDILLSPTSIFARKLLERGVDARLVIFDGLPHAFWAYMAIPETDEANILMSRFLRARLSPARRPDEG